MLTRPTSVYINWSAYDELSDDIELTEEIAMRQLDELLRLRGLGVRFDYYMMDCFWFAPEGGYRTWRKPHWPDGPDRWLSKCLENNIKPGLWVEFNNLSKLQVIPEWRDSHDENGRALCLFYGGYLPHLMQTLDGWYQLGVRMFKWDFGNFAAAPLHLQQTLLPHEIRQANCSAFQGAMKAFKREHPEIANIAYNGLEERPLQNSTDLPLHKALDHRWLEVFDSLYCGDPRPADVPAMNFWRSKDVYSDHMVRVYELNDIPLERIDNAGFMIGRTGTCYYRGKAAWKGMLLLSLARGGFVNTYYGNLDLLDGDDARWFAQAQRMYYEMRIGGLFSTFGAMPGTAEPYGFLATKGDDALITVVNPTQRIAEIDLPASRPMRVLFRDAGFEPVIDGHRISLGPEQMAVIGAGAYADARHDLGVQEDVRIPRRIEPLSAEWTADGEKAIRCRLSSPPRSTLRIIMRQTDERGKAKRTSGGSPPKGTPLGQMLRIEAKQADHAVPLTIEYDKAIWSGLSWAVAEAKSSDFDGGKPLDIRCSTTEYSRVSLKGELHAVEY